MSPTFFDTPAGSSKSDFKRYPHKVEGIIAMMSRDKSEIPTFDVLSEDEAIQLASHSLSPHEVGLFNYNM